VITVFELICNNIIVCKIISCSCFNVRYLVAKSQDYNLYTHSFYQIVDSYLEIEIRLLAVIASDAR